MRGLAAPAAAAFAALAGLAGLGVLGAHAQHDSVPAGDHLGMEHGESWDDYRARAGASLGGVPGGTPVFALVTFDRPAGFADAAAVLDGVGRVDAVVFPGMAARAVPEPVAGEGRAGVFAREARQAGRAAGVAGADYTPDAMSAAVVHDTGDTLRSVAGRAGVGAVETLPADAVWGAFGIAPTAH